MSGVRLEAKVHIVTAAGLERAEHREVLRAYRAFGRGHRARAAGLRGGGARRGGGEELGVALVDIGGGHHRSGRSSRAAPSSTTSVIPLGGRNHLTNDIAVGLRTPMQEARRNQGEVRQRAERQPRQGRHHRGAQRGRARAPRVLNRRILCEIHRAAGGGAVPARTARDPEGGAGGSARQRPGADRRDHQPARACPSWPRRVLGLPVRRGNPRGIGRPHRRGEEARSTRPPWAFALRRQAGQGQTRLPGRGTTALRFGRDS